MSRFPPKSLLGQVMLVLAIALLVAQVISATLLYRASEQRREEAMVNAIALRVVMAPESPRAERIRARREARRVQRSLEAQGGRFRLPIERMTQPPQFPEDARLTGFEEALREVLTEQGITPGSISVIRQRAGEDAFISERVTRFPRLQRSNWQRRFIRVAAIERPELSRWQVVRLPEPQRQRGVLGGIIIQTLVIFAVLFAALYFVLRRLTRPLAQLTTRVDDFARQPGSAVALEETGPADMRRLIAAHNAMEGRISALLDEKDVMLGAIGHDLKTPLAALRVRIESVPDEKQRAQMATGIEEITASLDDILNLARVGRASEPAMRTDLTALAASLVEEYEDMGEPVTLVEGSRIVGEVRDTWLRRALRNLIGNAVRYGGSARVSVFETDGHAVFQIEDNGPGIPEGRIEALLEPFARGDASRNRATGGAGLGLTLARAVAELHGGSLAVSNRAEGGLRAEIRVPVG